MQFTYEGGTYHQRPLEVGDELDVEILADMLWQDGEKRTVRGNYKRRSFLRFVLANERVEGEVIFAIPDVDDFDAMRAGFEAFIALPQPFLWAVRNAENESAAKKKT